MRLFGKYLVLGIIFCLIFSCNNSRKIQAKFGSRDLVDTLNKQLLKKFGGESPNKIIKSTILDLYNSFCDMGMKLDEITKARYGVSTLNFFKNNVATKTFYFEIADFNSEIDARSAYQKLKKQADQLKEGNGRRLATHCIDLAELRINEVFMKNNFILIVNYAGYSPDESKKILEYLTKEFSNFASS